MHNIRIGVTGEDRLLVTSEVAISFMGEDGARVLSTPQMISYMERTCRNTVLPLLEAGFDTVGTHVNVRHLAAAPIGAHVVIRVEIFEVNDNRVQFRVEAWEERRKIGEGTHERAIVNVARFAERQKKARS